MVISARKLGPALSARATAVAFTNDSLSVTLEDGRRISVPIVWFPKLAEATEEQPRHWRLIGHGIGIAWDELDEDISVEGLMATSDDSVLTVPAAPDRAAKQRPRRNQSVVRDRTGRFVRV
jgi:hypothetical protein